MNWAKSIVGVGYNSVLKKDEGIYTWSVTIPTFKVGSVVDWWAVDCSLTLPYLTYLGASLSTSKHFTAQVRCMQIASG